MSPGTPPLSLAPRRRKHGPLEVRAACRQEVLVVDCGDVQPSAEGGFRAINGINGIPGVTPLPQFHFEGVFLVEAKRGINPSVFGQARNPKVCIWYSCVAWIYQNLREFNPYKRYQTKGVHSMQCVFFDGRRTKQTNEPSVLVEHRALLNSDPEHPIGSAASEPGEETLNPI